jgi:hypothetical protein
MPSSEGALFGAQILARAGRLAAAQGGAAHAGGSEMRANEWACEPFARRRRSPFDQIVSAFQICVISNFIRVIKLTIRDKWRLTIHAFQNDNL